MLMLLCHLSYIPYVDVDVDVVVSGDTARRGARPPCPWLRWRVARSLGRGPRAGAHQPPWYQPPATSTLRPRFWFFLPDSSNFCDIPHRGRIRIRIRKGHCPYTFIRYSCTILYLLLWTYCGKGVVWFRQFIHQLVYFYFLEICIHMAIISSFDVVIVVLISIISLRLQNRCAVKSSLWLRTWIVTACGYETVSVTTMDNLWQEDEVDAALKVTKHSE